MAKEPTTVAARDGCVVDSAPLSAMVREFVSTWKRERPNTGGQIEHGHVRRDRSEFVTPLEYLAAQSRLPQATLERVLYQRSPTTELRDADAIVAALGRPDVFHNGQLTIRPNPRAGLAARAACCGGSLTGAIEP